MPLPVPRRGESGAEFLDRCMGSSTMASEFPDESQRAAVCHSQLSQQSASAKFGCYHSRSIAQPRQENYQQRPHLVAPVVLLTEGVHHSVNMGRILHTREELQRFPGAWNGRPVTVHHPTDSASASPATLEQVQIGTLFGVHYTDENGPPRLVGEIWVDINKAAKQAPGLLDALQGGERVEVSTGVFHDRLPHNGVWNEEAYESIAEGYRPDHLALLPGARGACSWEDGCGTPRLNEEGGEVTKKNSQPETSQSEDQGEGQSATKDGLLAKLRKALGWSPPEPDENMSAFKTLMAEMSPAVINAEPEYSGLANAIQRSLDRMDREGKLHFLEALYEDFYVYRVATPDGEFYFKQTYSVTDNGFANTGDPVPVTKQVTWLEPELGQQREGAQYKEGEETMDVKEMVDKIIANSNGLFGNEDREHLAQLCPDTLKGKLAALEGADESAPDNNNDDNPADEGADDEGGKKAAAPAQMSEEEYLQSLPPRVAAALNKSLEEEKRRRAQLITHLENAPACNLSRDQLEALDETALYAMFTMAYPVNQDEPQLPPANYALRGGGGGQRDDNVPVLNLDEDYDRVFGPKKREDA